MRLLVAVALGLTLGGHLTAADDKLDEKFLLGLWKGEGGGIPNETVEFKADGTCFWTMGSFKGKGTYKLKGTTLEMYSGLPEAKTTVVWKDLSVKGGKLVQGLGGMKFKEWTRVKDKKEQK